MSKYRVTKTSRLSYPAPYPIPVNNQRSKNIRQHAMQCIHYTSIIRDSQPCTIL